MRCMRKRARFPATRKRSQRAAFGQIASEMELLVHSFIPSFIPILYKLEGLGRRGGENTVMKLGKVRLPSFAEGKLCSICSGEDICTIRDLPRQCRYVDVRVCGDGTG